MDARLDAFAIVLVALAPIACAHRTSLAAAAPQSVSRTTTTTGGAPSLALSDEQIAEILRTSFVAGIEEAETAGFLSPDPEIAHYAELTSRTYRDALDDEQNLIERGGTIPRRTHISDQIAFDSKNANAALTQHQGADLEQTFLSRQVVRQRRLLALIDDELLPAVQSDAQRNELLRVRPVVARLLAEASKMETWLLTQPR